MAIKEEVDETDLVPETYAWPRLVQAPMKRDKHVVLDLCAPSGNAYFGSCLNDIVLIV